MLISAFDVSLQKWVSSQEFPWLSDASGWAQAGKYETVRLAGVGTKVYIYARGNVASELIVYDPNTFLLSPLPSFPFLPDSDGYTNPAYYLTICMSAVGVFLYISSR